MAGLVAVGRLFTRARGITCVVSAALLFASQALLAQTWPAKPIRYIVPFPPGGSTDLISRHLAEKLPPRLGVPVVIENLGGAGGAIGLARVVQAPPRWLHHRVGQLRHPHNTSAPAHQGALRCERGLHADLAAG